MPSREGWESVLADGAGRFVSRIVHRLPDGSLHTWTSRQHRKIGGLQHHGPAVAGRIGGRQSPWLSVLAPAELGCWIAVLFMLGSACFALASYAGLAVLEICHGYWCWQLSKLSWWIVMVNLLGCIAFMVSALFAVELPASANLLDVWIVNLSTCIGALCFLIGAYLLLPEMASE